MSTQDSGRVLRADYDSKADALSILLVEDQDPYADDTDEISSTVNIALSPDDRPVDLEVLYPRRQLEGPADRREQLKADIATACERHGLDPVAIAAALAAAMAAPDRVVTISVGPVQDDPDPRPRSTRAAETMEQGASRGRGGAVPDDTGWESPEERRRGLSALAVVCVIAAIGIGLLLWVLLSG